MKHLFYLLSFSVKFYEDAQNVAIFVTTTSMLNLVMLNQLKQFLTSFNHQRVEIKLILNILASFTILKFDIRVSMGRPKKNCLDSRASKRV